MINEGKRWRKERKRECNKSMYLVKSLKRMQRMNKIVESRRKNADVRRSVKVKRKIERFYTSR